MLMNKISITACIAFSTKKIPDFYNNQSLRKAFGYSLAYY